jgi:putative MATE family efflux protein
LASFWHADFPNDASDRIRQFTSFDGHHRTLCYLPSAPNGPLMKDGIRQEIVSLAVPVVFSSLLQRITAVVDVLLVGGLGAAAIATVGIGQLLLFLVMAVVWGLSAGATVVVAQLWGAQRRDEAGAVGFQALLIGIVVGIGMSAGGALMSTSVPVFLGARDEVLTLLAPYLRVVFSFLVCSLVVNLVTAIMYGMGNTRPPLRVAALMNVVHIAVAYPLINGLWGMPACGVLGVAIATAVSETAGAVYLLVVGFRSRCLRATPPSARLMGRVIRVGLPVAGDRLLQQAGQLMYLKVVMLYGTAAYAAHQVGMAIEAMSFLPGLGISMAATTAVGQRLGARQLLQATIAHREANRLALLVMVGMGVVFFLAPGPLLKIFTADPEVVALGTPLLKIVAVLQIPLAVSMVLAGSLRGAGDTPALFWSTVVGSWGIRVPLAWVFATVLALDLTAVWSLLVADWLVRMTVLAHRYRSDGWRQRCLIHTTQASPVALATAKSG